MRRIIWNHPQADHIFPNDEVEQTTLEYMIDSKSRGSYKWLDWIVMDEHELSFCEKDRTRENTNLPKICSKTLKKYMFMFPLLGCRSHRLNLAVEAYIDRYLESEIDLVSNLMSKLSTLKEVDRLRMTSSLRPVKRNKTRLLGVIKMLDRYERLRPHIDDINPDVAELLPTAGQRNFICHHSGALSDFKSVTESLQRENVTIWESQTLFQSLIHSFPNFHFDSYLTTDAPIVHNTTFEDVIIKIQSGREYEMLDNEKEVALCLKLQNTDAREEYDDTRLSVAERALKRQRMKQSNRSAYIDTSTLR